MNLERRVFGRITVKEIIGAKPPAVPDTKDMLASELDVLLAGLKEKGTRELSRLLAEQEAAAAVINSRPGAMALAQDKIRMFNQYSSMYVDAMRQAGASNAALE